MMTSNEPSTAALKVFGAARGFGVRGLLREWTQRWQRQWLELGRSQRARREPGRYGIADGRPER